MARLPSGYTKLEYIQATGDQYIDTGIKPGNQSKMELVFVSQSSSGVLGGCDAGWLSNGFAVTVTAIEFYNKRIVVSLGDGAQHTVVLDKGVATIDGTSKGTIATGTFTSAYSIYLFANNRSGSASEKVSAQLYSCKIWDNDTLVMDLTPCKNGAGTIGLYDSVGAQFLANAGTGTFTAGPEVPEGPDTPQDLAAAVSDTGAVTLTWSASTGAAGYRVYRDGGLLADTTQTTAMAQLAPFGAALFAVSAYNGDGESNRASLVAYFRPGQPLLYLITDRTLADVDRIAQLAARVSAGTATDAEKTEWASDLKGAYNASDLNRVGAAVAYVAGRLNGYGYAVTVNPKQDWTGSDIPTAEQLAAYLRDVAALRGAIAVMDSTPPTPDSASELTWREANDIERILLDVDELLTRMAAAWFYSGDLYAGEV